MAPLDFDADHKALLAIANPLRVSVFIDSRARYRGRPWVKLFARGDLMLHAAMSFRDALAWLQAGRQEADHGQP